MAVKIPGVAVARSAPDQDDIEAPTLALLRGLSLLPTEDDAKKNGPAAAFRGAPDSVAVIEAGATAASKGWAVFIAGGAAAVAARVVTVWESLKENSWNQPFAILALGIVFAAAVAGRMSRVPWNFGGGPMILRLRSRSHHDGRH